MEPVFRPTTVTYTGLHAENHLIDAQELGKSLIGLGRVANSITHFYLYGEIVKDPRLLRVRYFAGPPQENGVLYEIAALMAAGQLPIFAPLLCDLAEEILPYIWAAVVARASGQPNVAEQSMACGTSARSSKILRSRSMTGIWRTRGGYRVT